MSERLRCLAKVKKSGKQCSREGNSVLDNGYCRSHQYEVVLRLFKLLTNLDAELKSLSNASDSNINPQRITQMRNKVKLVRQSLENAKNICESDPTCGEQLQDIMVDLREITEGGGFRGRNNNLKNLQNGINHLQMDSQGPVTWSKQISQDWELGHRRNVQNNYEMNHLQNELNDVASEARMKEMSFKSGLEDLSSKLSETEQQKREALRNVQILQEQVDKVKGGAAYVNGVYSQTISQTKDELKKYKDLYTNMVGREIRLNKTLKQISKSEQELKNNLSELEEKYAKKMKDFQDELAKQVQSGHNTLSSREEELTNEVEELKAHLEQASVSLEQAIDAGRMAQNASLGPTKGVASELLRTTQELRMRQEETNQLQNNLDALRMEYANREQACEEEINRQTDRDRTEISRLGNRIVQLEQDLSSKQSELMALQSKVYQNEKDRKHMIGSLQSQLRRASSQLSSLKAEQVNNRQQMMQKMNMLKKGGDQRKIQQDFEYSQLRATLESRFMERQQKLERQHQVAVSKLMEEKRNLDSVQRQIKEAQEVMTRQKGTLDNYRQAYEKKMDMFLQQKQALDTSLQQANIQVQEFSELEAGYKQKVNMLRQKISVDRQRYQATIDALKGRLNMAEQSKSKIVGSLEKCSAAKDVIVQQINQLQTENTRMKDQYLQLKSRMESMKLHYETYVEKMRADAGSMQSDMRRCAKRLEDASLVHDHVKQMKEEGRALRANLESKIREAQGNASAMKRLLADRELSKAEIIRMQSSLKDCSEQNKRLNNNLLSTNTELRTVKQIDNRLKGDIRELSETYTRNLEQRETDIQRDRYQQEFKEKKMLADIAKLNTKGKQMEHQIGNLRHQKDVVQNALANTEISRQEQIAMLMEAQRLEDPAFKISGKSSLIQF